MTEQNESKNAYDNMNVEATMENLVKKFGRQDLVEAQITAKIEHLGGYLTRIGAVQLLAREKGVPIEWKSQPLDTSTMQRITLREVTLDRKNDVVEVAVVITRASEPRMTEKGRSFVFFTLDDGHTSADIIVFGQTKYGMFASWVGQRVIIRPLKIGEYEGQPQLRVVNETEVLLFEEVVEATAPTAPKGGGT